MRKVLDRIIVMQARGAADGFISGLFAKMIHWTDSQRAENRMNNFCRWQVGAAKARFTPSDFPRLCRGTCEGEQHKGTKKTHTTRSMSVCGQNKYHMIWCQQCVFLLFEIKSFFFFFSSPLKLVGVRLMNLQIVCLLWMFFEVPSAHSSPCTLQRENQSRIVAAHRVSSYEWQLSFTNAILCMWTACEASGRVYSSALAAAVAAASIRLLLSHFPSDNVLVNKHACVCKALSFFLYIGCLPVIEETRGSNTETESSSAH